MRLVRSLLGLFLLASPIAALAQTVVTLTDDVYLQWGNGNDPNGKFGVCGFMIIGNHLSRQNPKVVWDINIDEVWRGEQHVAGFSAGSFDVLDGKRTPRSPITELSFSLEGQSEPIHTEIIGAPNADNGVRGRIDLDRARALFDALSEERWITIALRYADATSEVLKTRGYHDPYHGGRSSPFNMCKLGKKPYGNLRRPVP